jgi:hypothetical protein
MAQCLFRHRRETLWRLTQSLYNGKDDFGAAKIVAVADNSKWRITQYFSITEIGGRFVLRELGG